MIPLWIKIAYTLFTIITAAIYAAKYPPENFLWFSDIGLVLTVPALWFESRLLASMLAVGLLLPETLWNVDYFFRLLAGRRMAGLTDYMFDAKRPRYLRALSLFHVFLPVLLLWMISRLGYAPQALPAQTALAWLVLLLTFLLTKPPLNVNWVFGLRDRRWLPPRVHLVLLMVAYPLLVCIPTHILLRALFR